MDALRDLLADCAFCITYTPLRDEVTLDPSLFGKTEVYTVAANNRLDPLEEARVVTEKSSGRKTSVLIPGTRFDASGTRHGRGGGWYDRFLAMAPKEWLRVGVCNEEQFSSEPLTREAWDEPVDYVAVKTAGGVALHATDARASVQGA